MHVRILLSHLVLHATEDLTPLDPANTKACICSAVKVLTYLTMPIDGANDGLPMQVRLAVPFMLYIASKRQSGQAGGTDC